MRPLFARRRSSCRDFVRREEQPDDVEILAELAQKKTLLKWVSLRNVIIIFCSVMKHYWPGKEKNAT